MMNRFLPAAALRLRLCPRIAVAPKLRYNSTSTSGPGNVFERFPKVHVYQLFPKTLAQGPPPAGPFDVDVDALYDEFEAVHKRLEPQTPSDKKQSMFNDMHLAYVTIADPLHRANYLLQKSGVDMSDVETPQDDEELVLNVLELQKKLEDSVDEEGLEDAMADVDAQIDECIEALGDAFKRDDLEEAKVETKRLLVWKTLQEEIAEMENTDAVDEPSR